MRTEWSRGGHGARRGQKRKNRTEVSFAVGAADAARSGVWTVWAQSGTNSVYMRNIRGQDAKVSLHDPTASKFGAPWVFGATDRYMEKHNDPVRTPEKVICRWGPFRDYGAERVEAVRLLIPAGELTRVDHAKLPGPAVKWFPEADPGRGAVFTIAFAESSNAILATENVLWSFALSNGYTAVLTAGEVTLGSELVRAVEADRVGLREQWLADVASGRVSPGSAPGTHGAHGIKALPPEGHRLTIVEWNALTYWVPDSQALE